MRYTIDDRFGGGFKSETSGAYVVAMLRFVEVFIFLRWLYNIAFHYIKVDPKFRIILRIMKNLIKKIVRSYFEHCAEVYNNQ